MIFSRSFPTSEILKTKCAGTTMSEILYCPKCEHWKVRQLRKEDRKIFYSCSNCGSEFEREMMPSKSTYQPRIRHAPSQPRQNTMKKQVLASQDDKCAICGSELTGKCDLDHDHKTGKVRGVLCHSCNIRLVNVELCHVKRKIGRRYKQWYDKALAYVLKFLQGDSRG